MRTETIPFNEFMAEGYIRKEKVLNSPRKAIKANLKNVLKASVTIPFVLDIVKGSKVFTQEVVEVGTVPEATKQSILHAFDPLIDLMIDLALPIADCRCDDYWWSFTHSYRTKG